MAMNGGTRAPSLSQQPAVKSVTVYRNGDPFYRGRRMIIHEKKVGNFEVFLRELSGGVGGPFGAAVRNVYTPRAGHRVKSLEDLHSGEHYVAGGGECFKKIDYLQIGDMKRKPVDLISQVKPVSHSRINVSARFRKPIQEPCTIFVIANGDILNPAVRLLIPRKSVNQWDHILAMVTDKVHLRTGAVHRLYTLEGKPVQHGSELENGQFYVAVGRDKFKKLPYGDLIFSKSSMRRPHGPKASSLPPINGSRKYKEGGNDRQSKSTEGYSDSADALLSPQPVKRKGGKQRAASQEETLFPSKPIKVTHSIRVENSDPAFVYPENDDSIFKAGEKRSETWGATEVQEDEETQVEVPVDQRTAETVEEENGLLDEEADELVDTEDKENDAEELEEDGEGQVAFEEENEDVEDPEEEENELRDSDVINGEEADEEKIQDNSEDAENEEENLDEQEEEEPEHLNSEPAEGSGDEDEPTTTQNGFHPDTENFDETKDNESEAEEDEQRGTSSKLEESPRDGGKND
ncbi:doublecortin domain-containing protein 2 isoform X2 [Pleurodeles waltl]